LTAQNVSHLYFLHTLEVRWWMRMFLGLYKIEVGLRNDLEWKTRIHQTQQ